jgi:hypothetical protein
MRGRSRPSNTAPRSASVPLMKPNSQIDSAIWVANSFVSESDSLRPLPASLGLVLARFRCRLSLHLGEAAGRWLGGSRRPALAGVQGGIITRNAFTFLLHLLVSGGVAPS